MPFSPLPRDSCGSHGELSQSLSLSLSHKNQRWRSDPPAYGACLPRPAETTASSAYRDQRQRRLSHPGPSSSKKAPAAAEDVGAGARWRGDGKPAGRRGAAVGGRPDEGLCGKKLLAELGGLGARAGIGEGTPKAPRELSRSSWCRLRQCPILDSSARTGTQHSLP